ncbi:hypothetical protein D3C71_1682330 [compost metagenome]
MQSPVPGGPRVAYSLDILPRLKHLIQSGGHGGNAYDKNLANYKLVGSYLGQTVFGAGVSTTSYDNFNIISTP